MAWTDTNTMDLGHKSEQRTFNEQVIAQPGMHFTRLFFMDSSTRPSEVFVGQGDQARMTARVGSSIAAITQRETFKALFSHVEYAAKLTETIQAWTDRSPERRDAFRMNLARSAGQTLSYAAWSVLANAFDGAVTMGAGHDGKSLCATDHPIYPGAGTTWSNKATAALSSASLGAAQAAMKLQVSASGEVYELDGAAFLIVGPQNTRTAKALTTSLYLGLGTAGTDNIAEVGTNPLVSDGLEVLESSILGAADINNWFLARRPDDSGLTFIMRMDPMLREGDNPEDLIHWINGSTSFSCGWKTGRQIYGSEVA